MDDIMIIGGGAAGLSAATTLARARRSVVVVDDGTPRNAPAAGVHNLLGREGMPPAELLRRGRAEAAGYGARFVDGRAVGVAREDGGFTVTLADGATLAARRLLVTTGLVDELPADPVIRGLPERWGRDVLHCPYCHGWEVRDQVIGVLATGPLAVHQAQLLRQWSADVVLLRHTAPAPSAEELAGLTARGIAVVEGEVAAVEVADDRLTGVRLRDGGTVLLDALVVAPRFVARSALLDDLGLAPEPLEMNGFVVGEAVPSGPDGATAVPGVWLAGNVTDLRAAVANVASAGFTAAVAINVDLLAEDVRLAVEGAPA